MDPSNAFDGLLATFASRLCEAGIGNHPPQTGGMAAEYADILLTELGGKRFFPKLALHVERWDASEADAREFRDFASITPGPHDSFWLYVRLAPEADLVLAARHVAGFVERRWLRGLHRRQRITWLEVIRSGCVDLLPPRPTKEALVAERLGAWLADASIGDIADSRLLRSVGEGVTRAGTVVGLARHGCWIELDGERYWAFLGSFRQHSEAASLERLALEAASRGGLGVAFRPVIVSGERFATRVSFI